MRFRTAILLTFAAVALQACHATPTYKGWIAFVANLDGQDDIYLINPISREVRPLKIGPGAGRDALGAPAWSPDYDHLAFFARGGSAYVIDLLCLDRGDCSESLVEYSQPYDVWSASTWSQDGGSLLFTAASGDFKDPFWIITLELADRHSSVLLREGGGTPDASSTGSEIIFDAGDNLMTYTPSTGITSTFLESATSLSNSIEGEWSPSANQVAFMSTLGQGLAYGVQYEVFVADADGTDPRQVASNGLYPDWSPDGRQLVFEREDGLYVLDLSSGDEQRILEMPKIHYAPMPAWSP